VAMKVILVRYAELGLKSRMVRRRFENLLRDNILSALSSDGVEALLRSDEGRFYAEADDTEAAVRSLRRVFGVASVSLAETCSSDLEDIRSKAAEYSRGRMREGQSFAVRPRREGSHPYSSMDVGREAGSAVMLANQDRGVTVDLNDPDFELYVEVRGPRAYLFDSYMDGPGGLPMGSQGKVLAIVDGERDALAAWMMMKRGCRAVVLGEAHPLLQRYDPELRTAQGSVEDSLREDVLGLVMGLGMEDMDTVRTLRQPVPLYLPLMGMDEKEIVRRLEEMV